jgi:hypothetical protein
MIRRLDRAIYVPVLAAALSLALSAPLPGQVRSAEPFQWEGRIQTGATLEIKGVNGPVHAVAGSGPTVRVEASRSARRSDPSEVEIVVVEHAAGVTICAVYPSSLLRRNECRPGREGNLSSSNNDTQVAFAVELPASLAFTARTSNGRVVVEGLTGPTAAYTTNGNVQVEGGASVIARTTNGSVTLRGTGDAEASTTNGSITATIAGADVRAVSLRTTNGAITLRLPEGTNASIDARTSNGAIRSDLPVTIGSSSRNRLQGTLGRGGPTIEMRTTNGAIRLERS